MIAIGLLEGGRFIVGQARTYIAAPDDKPDRIDVAAACESLLAGRVLLSMGLLAQMTVGISIHAVHQPFGMSG